MIIAPLMTLIMGVTLAIILGNGRRTGRSMLIVLLSIAYVIGLAVALSALFSPVVIGFGANPEIAGRISSNLIALYAALASGTARAFAVSRSNLGDISPGVAIAISLVQPPCVVGIAFAHARWFEGLGALVLFLTSSFAIVLAGGDVFWLSGVHARRQDRPRSTCAGGQCRPPCSRRSWSPSSSGSTATAPSSRTGIGCWPRKPSSRGWRGRTSMSATSPWSTGPKTSPCAGWPVPGIELLSADLRAGLGYDVGVELRVLPGEIHYFPEQVLVLPGWPDAWESAPWWAAEPAFSPGDR